MVLMRDDRIGGFRFRQAFHLDADAFGKDEDAVGHPEAFGFGDEAFDRKFPQRPKGAASNPPVGEVVALKPPEIVKMDIDFDSIFEAGVRSGLIPPDSDKEAAKDKYNEDAKRRKTEGVAK